MPFQKIIFIAMGLLLSLCSHASDLSEKLQSSHYVLLMRHTRAPGIGDPAGYTLADCKSQRNLSKEGRQQAVVVGQWLRQEGVATAQVHSSAWCRCKDTAELLNFNGFKVAPALASFFDDMHTSKVSTLALEKFIAKQLNAKGSEALILVTHHVNIMAYVGENVASGDMVLAQVDLNGKLRDYKVIDRPNPDQLKAHP